MAGGHFGEGGRYRQCEVAAYDYAFLIKAMGMLKTEKQDMQCTVVTKETEGPGEEWSFQYFAEALSKFKQTRASSLCVQYVWVFPS